MNLRSMPVEGSVAQSMVASLKRFRRAARYLVVGGLPIAAALSLAVWSLHRRAAISGIRVLSETIRLSGDSWIADFIAQIPAPEARVYAVIEHVEDAHSATIESARLLSQKGNTKTVELMTAGPVGQTLALTLMFEYHSSRAAIGWVSESRNVRDDFRKFFGLDLDHLDGIAIMTDCDNSGRKGAGYYSDIYFAAK